MGEPQHDPADETGAEARARAGRSFTARVMEWLALRELRAENRARYAEENARERAEVNRMRAARNDAVDRLDRELRQAAVGRESRSADRVAEWVEANARASELRTQTKAELKAAARELRAAERQRRAAMREERNRAQDEWGEHRRACAAKRETDSAQRRAEWVHANADAADLRREARRARKEELARIRREHADRRAAMREERNRGQDMRDAERREAAAASAAREAELAQEWADARGDAGQARRAMRAERRAMRRARAEARAEWRALDDRARRERNEMVDRLSMEADAAARASAAALAEARDAARRGDTAQESSQCELAQSMRQREASLRAELRQKRNRADDQRADKCRAFIEEHSAQIAMTRDGYRAAVQESGRRRQELGSNLADLQGRAARERHDLEARLRQERNREMDERGREYRDLDVSRELRLSELNEGYVEARERERELALKVRAADTPARSADLTAERREAQEHRRLRNAASEARGRESRELDVAREQALLQIRQPYLEARQAERAAWREFKGLDAARRREDLASERELACRVREERNALLDEFDQAVRTIDRERELARCDDRKQARKAAHAAYETLLEGLRADGRPSDDE